MTREYMRRIRINPDLLGDKEALAAAVDFLLPQIGQVLSGYRITGKAGEDQFLVDGLTAPAVVDGLIVMTVFRQYTVEKCDADATPQPSA